MAFYLQIISFPTSCIKSRAINLSSHYGHNLLSEYNHKAYTIVIYYIILNIYLFANSQKNGYSICFTRVCISIMAYCHQPATIRSSFAMTSKKFHMPIWITLLHLIIHICVFSNLIFVVQLLSTKVIPLKTYCKIAYKIIILFDCFCTSLFKHLNDFTSG